MSLRGIAIGLRYGFGNLHQPVEIVSGQSQSQLVQGVMARLPKKYECRNRTLVQTAIHLVGCPSLTQRSPAGALFLRAACYAASWPTRPKKR
jgi:hypothetical protein